ncbi:MAG: hypothetical protein AAF939_06685 [Planctomycetota bacterium]
MIDLIRFVNDLMSGGSLKMPRLKPWKVDELQQTEQVLVDLELDYRNSLPGLPPPFAADWAVWASQALFRVVQFYTFREYPDREVIEELKNTSEVAPESGRDSSAHYSVDFLFRFIPDLWNLIRLRDGSDPLLLIVQQWAIQWPLSSVGILQNEWSNQNNARREVKNKHTVNPKMATSWDALILKEYLEPILRHPSLAQLYTDRIVKREDSSRIDHPKVVELINQNIGIYANLIEGLTTKFDLAQNSPNTKIDETE